MGKIAISTECVGDIPVALREELGIEIIFLDVVTDQGVFKDTVEITDRNVIEYMMGGLHKCKSREPDAEGFRAHFEELLKCHDEVIHICISGGIATSVKNTTEALALMKPEMAERVHIVDSRHLSSGQGMLVCEAAKLRNAGAESGEIIQKIQDMREKISTSFIARNADFLYYNGRASEKIMKLCNNLALHPVLYMKDGMLVVKRILIGNYDKACERYVKRELKKSKLIDRSTGYITYAGCSNNRLEQVRKLVEERIRFDNLYLNAASAAVSCNCGPDTFGILFKLK